MILRKKLVQVKKSLPEELDLRVSFNRANYVEAAIEEVYKTLVNSFCFSRFNNLSISW